MKLSHLLLNSVLALLAVQTMNAGQSIEYGAQFIYDETMPATPTNRVEEMVCWASPGLTHVITGPGGAFGNGAFGWFVNFQTGPPFILSVANAWDNGVGATINLAGVPNGGSGSFPYCILIRFQHDIPNLLDDYEAWDLFGNRFFSTSVPYATETDSGIGILLGFASEPTVAVGFIRASTTLLPLNSIPPTTFSNDPNRVFEWKFDGTLADATGHGYTAIYGSGSPTYIATPYQSPPISIIQANPTVYGNVTSVRAGTTVPLSGVSSYSQADTSASVTCQWNQISGPSVTIWNGTQGSCTAAPIGLIWGDYVFALNATDVNGITGVSQAEVGVVAQDSKGIVVNADLNADAILGNMIAYGQNPWQFADYWQGTQAGPERAAYYTSAGWVANGPQWEQTGAGTVSYKWMGVGIGPGDTTCADTLTGNINATTLSIPISNASCLDLLAFPTRIVLANSNFPSVTEEVRVCSASGTSGAATLTACYDGRGSGPSTAVSWSSGQLVGQYKVTGTGTNFLTDVNAAVCPIGASSPTGPSYATGLATLTAGSSTVTGGSGFTLGMVGSYYIATATHSGTPYVFVRQIATYISATSITLANAFPSDSDTGSYTFNVTLGQRTIDLRGQHVVDNATTGQWMWNVTGCESATALYLNPFPAATNEFFTGKDLAANDGRTMSPYKYGVTDSNNWVNESQTGGIDFYGEDLAMMNLCLRSGYTWACTAWHNISNWLIASPWGNIENFSFPQLFTGGLGIAGFASAALGAGSGPGAGQGPAWGDLRSYAANGEALAAQYYNSGAIDCNTPSDTRDSAYAFAWLTLAALYDPNPTFQNRWIADISTLQLVDAACIRADGSWANTFLWYSPASPNFSFGPVTLTNGSTAVTGTGLPAHACNGTAKGTGTVTSGSGLLSVTGGDSIPASGSDTIVVTGTKNSGASVLSMSLMINGSGSSTQMAAQWPGDSGSVVWMTMNTGGGQGNAQGAYGTSNTDYTNLANNYACEYNSSSSLTLDHPWVGTTGSSYLGFQYTLSGYGQQPYYDGIQEFRLNLVAQSTLPALGSLPATYQGYAALTGSFLQSSAGTDAVTLAPNYGSGFGWCAASIGAATNNSAGSLPWKSPNCNYPNTLFALPSGREENSEFGSAYSIYYRLNPTSGIKDWSDKGYGSVWGANGYNLGGVYSDSNTTANNVGQTNLFSASYAQGKWYGFFAGMGSVARWPAARLGGVDTPVYADIYQPFTLAAITGATKVNITVTAASGLAASTVCSTSPCHLTNIRQHTGWALLKIDYENSGSTVIVPGISLPLYVP